MMKKKTHQCSSSLVITVCSGVVLLLAVFFTGGATWIRSWSFPAPIAGQLPREVLEAVLPHDRELRGEWKTTVEDLANSPETSERVNKILQFDAAAYRTYRSRNSRVSIFAAYWRPGKVMPRQVAGHTPDVCWEAAGWRCTYYTTQSYAIWSDAQKIPVKVRHFVQDGAQENVVFWHFSGHKWVSYSNYGRPPVRAFFQDLLDNPFGQHPEQLFVRISSSLPSNEMFATQPVRTTGERLHLYLLSSPGRY